MPKTVDLPHISIVAAYIVICILAMHAFCRVLACLNELRTTWESWELKRTKKDETMYNALQLEAARRRRDISQRLSLTGSAIGNERKNYVVAYITAMYRVGQGQ